jgi:hypothetical protein
MADIAFIIAYKNTSGVAIYGTAADYTSDSTVQADYAFFQNAFIGFLEAANVHVVASGSIYGGNRYNANGSDNVTSASGFYLGADGVLKMDKGSISATTISGAIVNAGTINGTTISGVSGYLGNIIIGNGGKVESSNYGAGAGFSLKDNGTVVLNQVTTRSLLTDIVSAQDTLTQGQGSGILGGGSLASGGGNVSVMFNYFVGLIICSDPTAGTTVIFFYQGSAAPTTLAGSITGLSASKSGNQPTLNNTSGHDVYYAGHGLYPGAFFS